MIESAYYRFEENVRRSDGAGGSGAAKRAGIDSPTTYRISFSVIPKSVPYRSQRTTPSPTPQARRRRSSPARRRRNLHR
ncbi:hypothetical protein [Diaphorobacter aerolatus]|uniref:hypothetical protein n=1 Tax=Diaphorobacter aerolatus TaxID=1288495 RepID=UPI001D006F17|nr:hypothetical protein [Diaphorobacter aerolatus]